MWNVLVITVHSDLPHVLDRFHFHSNPHNRKHLPSSDSKELRSHYSILDSIHLLEDKLRYDVREKMGLESGVLSYLAHMRVIVLPVLDKESPYRI